jgi:hypothetical protein
MICLNFRVGSFPCLNWAIWPPGFRLVEKVQDIHKKFADIILNFGFNHRLALIVFKRKRESILSWKDYVCVRIVWERPILRKARISLILICFAACVFAMPGWAFAQYEPVPIAPSIGLTGISSPPAVPDLLPESANGSEVDSTPESPRLPGLLNRPILDEIPQTTPFLDSSVSQSFNEPPIDPPLGYAGRSTVLPAEPRTAVDAIPMPDRWRIGFPAWDRAKQGGQTRGVDMPYSLGRWWDPYNQNQLKGDYPIIGQNIFLNVMAKADLDFEARQIPTQTSAFL